MRAVVALALAVFAISSSASADSIRTHTFGDGSSTRPVSGPYVEDGITATGYFGSIQERLHLEVLSGVSEYSVSAEFITGGLFDALSIDIIGSYHGVSLTCPTGPNPPYPDPSCADTATFDDPIDFVLFRAFRDGVEIGSLSMGPAFSQTVSLGSLPRMDMLRIEGVSVYDLGINGSCSSFWCNHFSVDNLVLNVVPEPATALLVGAGLAGIGVRRRNLTAREG